MCMHQGLRVIVAGAVCYRKDGREGERIPLTICDYDREAGTITIVVQKSELLL